MKIKFITHILNIIIISTLTLFTNVNIYSSNPGNFRILDEDVQELKNLGLSDKDIEEARNLFDNMSPEEEEQLMSTMHELEKEMINYGIDPLNPDPKKLEEFSQELTGSVSPEKEQEHIKPTKPSKEKEENKKIIIPKATRSTKDAQQMVKSLLNSLIDLRQKSLQDKEFNHKIYRYQQELNELIYFLNIVTKPNLIAHLVSDNFKNLYDEIINLYNVILKQEPKIYPQSIDSFCELDDPYQELGISYNATQREIDNAYNKLYKEHSPKAIESKLKDKNINKCLLKKEVEKAKVIFAPILDAYQRLATNKERKITDRELKEKISCQRNITIASNKAFDKVLQELNQSFFNKDILGKFKALLKDYEPQALAQQKVYEEQQKIALEHLKNLEKAKASGNKVKIIKEEKSKKVPLYRIPYPRPMRNAPSRNIDKSGARKKRGIEGLKEGNTKASSSNQKGGTSKTKSTKGKSSRNKGQDTSKQVKDDKLNNIKRNIVTEEGSKDIEDLSYILSSIESNLSNLDEFYKNNITFKELNQYIKGNVKSQPQNIEKLDRYLNTIKSNLKELNSDQDTAKINKSMLLKNRWYVIKNNYNQLIQNLGPSLNKTLSPSQNTINPEIKKIHYNNKVKKQNNHPINYLNLLDNASKISGLFNLISKDIEKHSDNDLSNEEIKNIKIGSALLSKLETNLNELNEEVLIEKIPKDLIDRINKRNILSNRLSSNKNNKDILKKANLIKARRENADKPQQRFNLSDLMNCLISFTNNYPKKVESILNQLKDHEDEIVKSIFLSSRFKIIKNNYSSGLNNLYQLFNDNLKENKMLNDINDIAKKRSYNKNFNLNKYYNIVKSIHNNMDSIDKSIINKYEKKDI